MRRCPLLLACLPAVLGCDGDVLAALAEVEVSPDRLDFGAVATGEARTLSLTVSNRSPTADLAVTALDLLEGSAASFAVLDALTAVPAGGEATVRVRYTADGGEADAGQLHLDSNARNAPRILVPVEAAPTFSEIRVVPDRLDMGDLAAGDAVERTLDVENHGLDTLRVRRASLRTTGFQGEACRDDGDCREGRCAASASGPLCATDCASAACAAPWACDRAHPLGPRCVEDGPSPSRAARGFALMEGGPLEIAPGERHTLTVRYAPGPDDRGAAQLVLESSDPDRPFLAVPLLGRPDDRPPVADAVQLPPAPRPLIPGSIVPVDGRGSFDPERGPLGFRWSFARRPEGSRALIRSAASATTAFTVDLPGTYRVALEVRDSGGLASSNDAHVEVEVAAGARVRLVLRWDRDDTDLDLHLVRPGAAVGSVGDCFFDNAAPDWPPGGAAGDPRLLSGPREESIAIDAPADGTYTAVVTVAGASPQGACAATLSVEYESVEVARYQATLAPPTVAWDVATLSRPSGRVTELGTLR